MKRRYDLAVVIGRFQPIHRGHVDLLKMAAGLADKTLILVGSSNAPRSPRNPWSFKERREMIELTLDHEKFSAKSYDVQPINDSLYDDQSWIDQIRWKVETTLRSILVSSFDRYRGKNPEDLKVCLVGFEKDSTSYYLRYFPEWRLETPVGIETIDATSIRELFYGIFSSQFKRNIRTPVVPVGADSLYGSHDLLSPDHILFKEPAYQEALIGMAMEWDYIKNYDPSKFPVFVTTVDAVVVCNGHILLIERKNSPGKGLYALPGGHVNPKERLLAAALRELREETTIDVSTRILQNSVKEMRVFDHPERSERARVITHAYLIKLEDYTSLPKISHSDDASDAFWLPIGEVRKEHFFEDHADIIHKMVSLL